MGKAGGKKRKACLLQHKTTNLFAFHTSRSAFTSASGEVSVGKPAARIPAGVVLRNTSLPNRKGTTMWMAPSRKAARRFAAAEAKKDKTEAVKSARAAIAIHVYSRNDSCGAPMSVDVDDAGPGGLDVDVIWPVINALKLRIKIDYHDQIKVKGRSIQKPPGPGNCGLEGGSWILPRGSPHS